MEAKPEPKAGMNLWQQIAAYGVGTVALVYMLPRLINSGEQQTAFIQTELISTLKTTTAEATANQATSNAGLATAASSMERLTTTVDQEFGKVTEKLDELVDQQQLFIAELKPLTTQLKRTATAVEESTEQAKVNAEASP